MLAGDRGELRNRFRRRLRALSVALVCGAPLVALGQQDASPRPENAYPPESLAVAGGVSLGAYQAGFLYYYSEFYKTHRRDLVSVSGASAGSINATIAAMEHCRERQPDPKASPFWNVWIPVGIDQLLPVGHVHTPVSVLSRAPLEGAAERLRILVESTDGWRSGPCQVPIGIVATRVAPDPRPNGLVSTAVTERFALVFDTQVPGRLAHWPGFGKHYESGATRPDDTKHDPAKRPVLHPGANSSINGYPSFGELRDLLFASSAFPLAFAPQALTSHRNVGGSVSTQLYIDGGVFDNIPVKLANEIAQRKPERRTVVDSDFVSWKPAKLPQQSYDSLMDAFGTFLGGFISAARTRDLPPELDPKQNYNMPERRAFLTSDFLFAFSGFLDERFRQLDFYLGMLDARSFLHRDHPTDVALIDEQFTSPEFACFRDLERLSLDFRQEPNVELSAACSANTEGLDKLVLLFKAAVGARRLITSGRELSEFDIFENFLRELQKHHFVFTIKGSKVQPLDVIYKLRLILGEELEHLANAQPAQGALLAIASQAALNQFLFRVAPDVFFSAGIHLNRGIDSDVSWGLGQANNWRVGLGLRVRQVSLLSSEANLMGTLNVVGQVSMPPGPLSLIGMDRTEFGVELGLGGRAHHLTPDPGESPDAARLQPGVLHSAGVSIGGTFYERIYARGDLRTYSRMSRHWPDDYGEYEVGVGLGWRFW